MSERAQTLTELREAIARQPHVPPCLLFYPPECHPGAECSCWVGRAADFVGSRLAVLPSAPEGRQAVAGVCSGCGGPHAFDTSVPSHEWNAVIRAGGLPDYLCTSCVVRAFVKAGRSFAAELYGDGFRGETVQIVVNGQDAQTITKLRDENNLLRSALGEIQPDHPLLAGLCRPPAPEGEQAAQQDDLRESTPEEQAAYKAWLDEAKTHPYGCVCVRCVNARFQSPPAPEGLSEQGGKTVTCTVCGREQPYFGTWQTGDPVRYYCGGACVATVAAPELRERVARATSRSVVWSREQINQLCERLHAMSDCGCRAAPCAGCDGVAEEAVEALTDLEDQLAECPSVPAEALFSTVVEGLRHAIADHGPITLDLIQSAAKRIVGRLK